MPHCISITTVLAATLELAGKMSQLYPDSFLTHASVFERIAIMHLNNEVNVQYFISQSHWNQRRSPARLNRFRLFPDLVRAFVTFMLLHRSRIITRVIPLLVTMGFGYIVFQRSARCMGYSWKFLKWIPGNDLLLLSPASCFSVTIGDDWKRRYSRI